MTSYARLIHACRCTHEIFVLEDRLSYLWAIAAPRGVISLRTNLTLCEVKESVCTPIFQAVDYLFWRNANAFLSLSRSKFRVALCVFAMTVVVPFAQARGPLIHDAVEVYASNSSPGVKALLLRNIRETPLCLQLVGAKNPLKKITNNEQYTVIGMSTLNCREGTGVAGVNNKFITSGNRVSFTIKPMSIEVNIQ
ncbi:hypothetical protein ACFQS6_22680 [Xanthomonas populi]